MKMNDDVIKQGCADLEKGLKTVYAHLVSIGSPRLRSSGVPVPSSTISDPETNLYLLFATEDSDKAHARYNAWIRYLIKCERSIERKNSTDA